MLDGFARSITYLRISITDRCNYRCRYCMPDGGIEKCAHEDICSLEELRDMAAAAVRCGVKKIRVTGGEPLVRRGAVDFCRMLSEIPGVEELCVTTNGSLLKEVAKPLRDAGVTHLNISLDTLNEERFRAITRLGTLQDVIDGIDAAERAGFAKIKLNCVLLGGVNDDALHRAHADGLRKGFRYIPPLAGGFGPLSGVGGRFARRRGRVLPSAGCKGDRRPHRADESCVLRRVQPHPHHGGREIKAVPAFGRRDHAAGLVR